MDGSINEPNLNPGRGVRERDDELMRVVEALERSQELSLKTMQVIVELLERQQAKPEPEPEEPKHELDVRRAATVIARGLQISSDVAPERAREYLRAAAKIVEEAGALLGAPLDEPARSEASAETSAGKTDEPAAEALAEAAPCGCRLDTSFDVVAPAWTSERERLLARMDAISPYIAEPLLDALAAGHKRELAFFRGSARQVGEHLEREGLARRLPTPELRAALRVLAQHSDAVTAKGRRWIIDFESYRG